MHHVNKDRRSTAYTVTVDAREGEYRNLTRTCCAPSPASPVRHPRRPDRQTPDESASEPLRGRHGDCAEILGRLQ
jgi:hypothetical protein